MKRIHLFLVLLSASLAVATYAKTPLRLLLERDVARFSRSIKGLKRYDVVSSVRAGGTWKGVPKSPFLENPFVVVNQKWQRLPETKQRQIAQELFNRWLRLPYSRHPAHRESTLMFIQLKPNVDPMIWCSEDGGCAIIGKDD